MAVEPRVICASEALKEGGTGVRFSLASWNGEEKGFVVRHRGRACAYVNQCPHAGTELDWQAGEFFDIAGLYLVCATHGALFEPDSGVCVAGPCRGASLRRLEVLEARGEIVLVSETTADNSKADT